MPVLSSSTGFSVPLLVVAAATATGWLAFAAVVGLSRRPPRIHAGQDTMDLPPEPPAIAGLLVNDFVVPSETAPAIVLDLAARGVVDLDEVQPGRTVCRMPGASGATLTDYEQRVLASLRSKAIDGVVPTDALTTGPEEQSNAWHRALAKQIVGDAQSRGLTHDRWPRAFSGALSTGLGVIVLLLYLAARIGGDTSGGRGAIAAIAGAVAVTVIAFGALLVGSLARSLAQLPTPAGITAATRVAGLERFLRDDRELADLPPAAVKVRGRLFAYAAAFGAARLAVALLPMGAEDTNRAWSRFGDRWRRVRVRYPRAWPPGWGKNPVVGVLLSVFWGAVAGVAIWGLSRLADSAGPSGITREVWDWVGRGALIVMIPLAVIATWAAFVLVRAVPDLWSKRTITGEIVRARRFKRASSGNSVNYWYYLAIDDGTGDRLIAFKVSSSIYCQVSEGDTATVVVTPRLGYVRSITRSAAQGGRTASA